MSPRYRLDLLEENADNVVAEQDHLFNMRYVAGIRVGNVDRMKRKEGTIVARPYAKLRGALVEREMNQVDLIRELALLHPPISMSQPTLSRRFNAKDPWTIAEMYAILDVLGIPDDQIHAYFPRNGQNESGCTRIPQK